VTLRPASFRRKPESRIWTPAFAGVTESSYFRDRVLRRRDILALGAAGAAGLFLPRSLRAGECKAHLVGLADESRLNAAGITPYDLSKLRTWITPTEEFFVRSHFGVPQKRPAALEVAGRVGKPALWSFEQVRALERHEAVVVLECAGNSVMQNHGLVSNARWGGTTLRALLDRVGPVDPEDTIVFSGADSRGLGFEPYARGMKVRDAVAEGALLAWEMNGQPLTLDHGAPLRLVVPNWYAMASVKWLARLEVRQEPFTGPFQTSFYTNPVRRADGSYERRPVSRLALKSVLAGAEPLPGGRLRLRGAAWGGEVERVALTFDLGVTWREVVLERPGATAAWRLWRYDWRPEGPGPFDVASRAFGARGEEQPLRRAAELADAPYARSEVVARRLEVRC